MNKSAIVVTNGCPENRIDCAEIEQCLIHHGWVMTQKANQADLIVLNLCGLLNDIETLSLNLIEKVKKIQKIDAKIIVTGCLPKINNPAIKGVFSGDIIKGHNIEEILISLNTNQSSNSSAGNYLIPTSRVQESVIRKIQRKITHNLSLYALLNHIIYKRYRINWDKINIVKPNTFYIKICSGCLHECSYCAVKLSRGVINSKSTMEIKQEFLKGISAGYTNFALIGTDLGSYGKDIQTDLPSLLKQLVYIEGNFHIKLRNVHPQLLINQLSDIVEILKSGKIDHITTAIQHGNDRILKLMNRRYTIKNCINAINTLKENNNNLKIRTQVIVGFPSETQKEFDDTLRLFDNLNVDFFEVYPFSPRVGILAARMKHQNTINTIQKRQYIAIKRLLTIQKQKGTP